MRDVDAAMELNVKNTIRFASIRLAKNVGLLEKRIAKATTQCYLGEHCNPSMKIFCQDHITATGLMAAHINPVHQILHRVLAMRDHHAWAVPPLSNPRDGTKRTKPPQQRALPLQSQVNIFPFRSQCMYTKVH